jgi:hypothetical protein
MKKLVLIALLTGTANQANASLLCTSIFPRYSASKFTLAQNPDGSHEVIGTLNSKPIAYSLTPLEQEEHATSTDYVYQVDALAQTHLVITLPHAAPPTFCGRAGCDPKPTPTPFGHSGQSDSMSARLEEPLHMTAFTCHENDSSN